MKVSSIVKTPMVRKAVSTAMLAAATLGVTNSMAKPNKIQEPVQTQTELMSPETALAIQASAPQNATISHRRNPKLDEIFNRLAKKEEFYSDFITLESENKRLDEQFKQYGTFVATIAQQLDINQKIIKLYGTENFYDEFGDLQVSTEAIKKYRANVKELTKWYDEFCSPFIFHHLEPVLNKVGSAEEVSALLDKIMDSNFIHPKEKEVYLNDSKEFSRRQQATDKVLRQSDLIAFKTWKISEILMIKQLIAMENEGRTDKTFIDSIIRLIRWNCPAVN